MSPGTEITLHVGDLMMIASGATDEPRVKDEEIAKRLGYSRLRDFRRLIRLVRDEGYLPEIIHRASKARWIGGKGCARERVVEEFWLTQLEAQIVGSRAGIKKAHLAKRCLVELMGTFSDGRHQLRAAPRAETASLALVHGNRMGDSPYGRLQVQQAVNFAARESKVGVRRIHGLVRTTFGVPGVYMLSSTVWETVHRFLASIANGDVQLPPSGRRRVAPLLPSNQMSLPGLPALALVR